ncbi:MAG: hypothetical protein M3N54_02750, partial [Acidobacteriota bacterium]|nr:hypothetical protein [Acidobacteriota bacterium]
CHRFGPVRLPAHAESWAGAVPPRDAALPANLPWLRLSNGTTVRAILRPDLPAEGYRAAATLHELRELRRAWDRVRL